MPVLPSDVRAAQIKETVDCPLRKETARRKNIIAVRATKSLSRNKKTISLS